MSKSFTRHPTEIFLCVGNNFLFFSPPESGMSLTNSYFVFDFSLSNPEVFHGDKGGVPRRAVWWDIYIDIYVYRLQMVAGPQNADAVTGRVAVYVGRTQKAISYFQVP
jgi:hypothetical protein